MSLTILAFTLLLSFWQVGLLLNDEWITANQLTNLKQGSLTVDEIKYGRDHGIYNMSGRPVGAYTVIAQNPVVFEQLIVKCKFRY